MKRVSILMNTWAGSSSEIIAGIGEYLRAHRQWVVQRLEASGHIMDRVQAFQPDGVIAVVHRDMEDPLRNLKVPVVNVAGPVGTGGFPFITFDAEAIGAIQVEHLYRQGHRDLAFIGNIRYLRNDGILSGATRRAGELGLDMQILDLMEVQRAPYEKWTGLLRDWLKAQSTPLGILTGHAEDAENVAQRCHELDLFIPEKVSIVTINNDQIAASLAYPEFTTVDISWRLFGYKAAQTLEACMEGTSDHPQPRELNIPPTGLTVRRSTDALVVKDPNVTRALAFIRENSHRPLTIPDVAAACGLSRRVLEKRFADLLGFSPFEEIRRQQLARVKTLLLNSDQTIEEIVPQTAFASPSHLSTAFRQGVGLSPRDFRRQFKRV